MYHVSQEDWRSHLQQSNRTLEMLTAQTNQLFTVKKLKKVMKPELYNNIKDCIIENKLISYGL
jgi:hypothetical protein